MNSTQRKILVLLVLSVAINYIDRGNLSVAAPRLSQELNIPADRLGALHSLFFLTYALFQIPSGLLVDRFNVNWVFAGGYALWSLATGMTGFASTYAALAGLRLLLGVGESVAYPSYSKLIASTFAEHQRGLVNGLLDAGNKIGPALGTLAGGLIVSHMGWRPLFLIIGFGSLLWLIPWIKWAPPVKQTSDNAGAGPSFGEIMGRREAWGTFLGLFCLNYAFYFLLTWMPYWLVKERHFSMDRMAVAGSLTYVAAACGSTFWGWLSDELIRRGYPASAIRKRFVILGLLCCSLLVPAAGARSDTHCILLITLALCTMTLASSHWAVSQRLAGPLAAGKWTGIQNCFGNLAGVTAPLLTGWIVESTGRFHAAFVLVAVMGVLGACSYGFLIPKVEPVPWRTP